MWSFQNRRGARAAHVAIAVMLLLWVTAGWVGAPKISAAEAARVIYAPPVPGPIVDNWRPPEHPYGAGNVGIDFFANPGDPVRAPANGVVTFAGPVGRSLFVVILHADGLRTTCGFLQEVLVPKGAHVTRGALIGIAAGPVHFGVRRGSTYIDPRTLFGKKVWLVE
jgi:murein DD-endopeptidase MepM/ murein hydrolase activator NlpD